MALVAVVVSGGAVFAYNRVFGGCRGTTDYLVAADPSIAPTISDIVASASAKSLGCSTLSVRATSSSTVAASMAKPESAPALWIPDSSLWLAKAARASGVLLELAAQSVATTPGVIAARRGEGSFFATWLSVLKTKGIGIGDPLTDTGAAAPIVGALSEIEHGRGDKDSLSTALVPLAQAQAANPEARSSDQRLAEVSRNGGLAIATEEQVIAYERTNPGASLEPMVPQSGSFVLDYPIAVTAPAGPAQDAAKNGGAKLAQVLASDAGRKALSSNGFRKPDFTPLDGERGLGAIPRLTVSDQSVIDATMKSYAVLALPTRALAVIDVSGSMQESAGAETRMALTVQAAETGLRLFPDNAQVGMWAFSIDQGGPGQDWRELEPVRRMTDRVEGSSQRERLLADDQSLPGLVGGGTGLYDTTLAAWRTVKEGYDPNAVNSVIVLTDGTDEDPSSMSLEQLLATLKKEQDPAKPVIIVTIGITDDADAAVLQQISAATGGLSYIARNPAEIPNVYVNALRSRPGGR
nr:substrate-binding domain-containing protein [Spelaeibacter cavernicola]